jgi:hypothetical protein
MRRTSGKTDFTLIHIYILLTYNIIKYKGWILTFKILRANLELKYSYLKTFQIPKLEGKFWNYSKLINSITYVFKVVLIQKLFKFHNLRTSYGRL